jgi:hypothetical protein
MTRVGRGESCLFADLERKANKQKLLGPFGMTNLNILHSFKASTRVKQLDFMFLDIPQNLKYFFFSFFPYSIQQTVSASLNTNIVRARFDAKVTTGTFVYFSNSTCYTQLYTPEKHTKYDKKAINDYNLQCLTLFHNLKTKLKT